jgi:putative ABC transport system ATP-binding protein
MLDALALVGLQERIAQLPKGLDTPLAATGHPLSLGSMMALRLANALLVAPKLLVLGQLYDLLPSRTLTTVLTLLKQRGTTTLLFTGRPEDMSLDGWFHLGLSEQSRFASLGELQSHLAARGDAHALPS